MPRVLDLPAHLSNAGWNVKIYHDEDVEPPHVTLFRRGDKWRWDLRTQVFMDREPSPRLIPAKLVDLLHLHHQQLCDAWDLIHPHNPVNEHELEEENG